MIKRLSIAIAKFKSLKRLSLFADLGYEALDLRPLSNLTELEVLQLGVVSRVESLQPLKDLPSLQTIAIGYAIILHKHGLDDLAKIPRLQVLSLPDLRSYPGLQDTVGKLKQSQTLHRINYGVSWDEADVLAAVQSQVTGIQVAPSMVRGKRHIVLFFSHCWPLLPWVSPRCIWLGNYHYLRRTWHRCIERLTFLSLA